MALSIIARALLLGAFIAGVWAAPAGPLAAAELTASHLGSYSAAPVVPQVRALPFPRSGRSQAVWAEAACWSGCQSYCGAGEGGCLQVDAQGRCLKLTDHCDRYCQRTCRLQGGPLVPDIFDF